MRLLLVCLLIAAGPAAAQTHTGSLGPNSLTRDQGAPYDAYTFEAQQGQVVRVRMEGDDSLDTYVIVRSPSGTEWTNDDFEWQINVSQVDLVAPEAGEWTAWASAYSSGQEGAYTLAIELGSIAQITTVEGRLDPRDPQTIKGEYYDTFTIDAPESGTFSVELVSYGFDGFLRVTAPSGQQWRNDDAGSSSVSRVENLRGMPGAWTVDVTSYSPESTGAYDLNVIVLPQE